MIKKLFTPGQVEVNKEVLKELSKPVVFHRSEDFEKLYKGVSKKLNTVFGANNQYIILILTGSGPMSNEAVINSLVEGRLLIISNGHFGERLATIARANGVDFKLLDLGWAIPFDLELIEKNIKKYRPKWIATVSLETSTGMINPVHKIGMLCKKYGVKLFVDSVSALAAEKLSVSKDYIDVCTSVANKAIEAPPGLSFICIKKQIVNSISKNKPKSYYLSIDRYYQKYLINQTPTTPAISLYFALDKALNILLKKGLKSRQDNYRKLSDMVQGYCEKLNIITLIKDPKNKANAITTLVLDSHKSAEKLQLFLQKYGYMVWHTNYGRKDKKLNSLLQVSVMGNINRKDVDKLFLKISYFIKNRYEKSK